jgi:hypothetical protein
VCGTRPSQQPVTHAASGEGQSGCGWLTHRVAALLLQPFLLGLFLGFPLGYAGQPRREPRCRRRRRRRFRRSRASIRAWAGSFTQRWWGCQFALLPRKGCLVLPRSPHNDSAIWARRLASRCAHMRQLATTVHTHTKLGKRRCGKHEYATKLTPTGTAVANAGSCSTTCVWTQMGDGDQGQRWSNNHSKARGASKRVNNSSTRAGRTRSRRTHSRYNYTRQHRGAGK